MKKIIFTVLAVCLLTVQLYCQDSIHHKNSFKEGWMININTGPNLYHGDINQYDFAPYKKDWALAYGLIIGKQFNPVFSLRGQLINGKIKGTKINYGDGAPANLRSETDIFEYSLEAIANFSNWIAPGNPERKLSVYGYAGLGMANWKAKLKDTKLNKVISGNGTAGKGIGERTSEAVIPVGLGFDYRINPNWGVNLETSIRAVNSDILDAADGGFEYDYYNYSFLGITYQFKSKVEKPSQEALNMEILNFTKDTRKPPKTTNISILSEIPSTVAPNTKFDARITINKGDIYGPAELHLTFPNGFLWTVSELTNIKAQYNNQLLTLKWEDLPEDSTLYISYSINCNQTQNGNYPFTGKFFYKVGNLDKIDSFHNTVTIDNQIKTQTENLAEELDEEAVMPESNLPLAVSDQTEYRVQIMAMKGEKEPLDELKQLYNITVPIKENYYKGYYIYTIGSFVKYQAALKYLTQVRSENKVSDAFIVKFRKGKRFAP